MQEKNGICVAISGVLQYYFKHPIFTDKSCPITTMRKNLPAIGYLIY